MKKKNAFTLVELIATIAIIAVISLVATVTYNKIRKDILEHQYLNLKSLIETAAIKYSSKNGYTSFFVQDLINDGLVETDDEDNVYDPRDDSPLNCHIVHVSVETNGMLSALMSDEVYEEDGICKTSSVNVYEANLKMSAKIEGTNVTYPVNSMNTGTNAPYIFNGWTRFNLDVTADPSAITATDDIRDGKYVWNNNPNRTTIEPTRTITTNEYGVYNDYYYLDLYTKSGARYNAKMLYKFDNEKPTIYKDEQGLSRIKLVNQNDEDVWMQSKTIFIYASDKNGSGLSRIYVGREKCSKMLTDTTMGQPAQPTFIQTYEVMIETGVRAGNSVEQFHVCVMDKAGNIAESSMGIKKIDITPPSCDDTIPLISDNDWTRNDRTITVKCTDAHYITEDGVERHLDGSGCIDAQITNTYTTTTRKASVVFEDNVGWKTTCEYNVLVDKTPPVCAASENDSTTWTKENRTVGKYCTDEHSGCREEPFTKTFTTTTKVGSITVQDKVGNTKDCDVNAYVDKTPPRLDPAPRSNSTIYRSDCPSTLNYTWVDDESGMKENSYEVYYSSSSFGDVALKVSGIVTNSNPKPKFWYQEGGTKSCANGYYRFILTGTDNVDNTSDPVTREYQIVSDPPAPTPTPAPHDVSGCNDRFIARVMDPSVCLDDPYNTSYMAVSDDTARCPMYGCNSSTKVGEFQIKHHADRKEDVNPSLHLKTQLSHLGSSSIGEGTVYYYSDCTSSSDHKTLVCSSVTNDYPFNYEIKANSCGEKTGNDIAGYEQECTVIKRACTQYMNGSEYLVHSNTTRTYNCCKSANQSGCSTNTNWLQN